MKNKIITYTAMVGDYEEVLTNDYVKVYSEHRAITPTRSARQYKCLTPNFDKYDFSIWVDANVTLKVTPEFLGEQLGDADILVYKHLRDCIGEEAKALLEGKYLSTDEKNKSIKQLLAYLSEGYPRDNGLAVTTYVIRRHNNRVKKFNQHWWDEICKHSERDQMSFNYSIWKNPDVKLKYFKQTKFDIHRYNDYFTYKLHNNKPKKHIMKFKESPLAHRYLDNLKGIEIGESAHNPFNLSDCINVDMTGDMNSIFKQGEYKLCGDKAKVDIIADGAHLPFDDNSYDYVINSHVIEHFFDPIAAIEEWHRVVKPGGYIFMIAPLQQALPGETRPCTKIEELLDRHSGKMKPEEVDMSGYQKSTVTGLALGEHGHWSVWNLWEFVEMCVVMKWNIVESLVKDDKVGNGFCVILKV